MTLQEYILQEKTLLDKFALDHRLMQNQSIEDWHEKFYEWSMKKNYEHTSIKPN